MVDATESGGAGESDPEQRQSLGIGRTLAGKYAIESLLGTGGMGSVYVARNVRTRKTWAVKVLHPEMGGRPIVLQRFLAEAQAAGVIGHPGIVEIIDQDRDGDLHFLVMPKLEGEELSARIARERPLPVKFVARVGAEVADAIEAAHRAKIVHRDLKPANVFLANKDGRRDVVQLLDFGIAKLMDDDNAISGITRTRDIYGTPHYMSPEQLKSAKDVDGRTDVYAIGVILYEALTGRRPYDADSLTALIVHIMTDEPPALETLRPDCPPAVVAIVKRAMARDRAARFPTAAALRDALRVHAGTLANSSDALADTLAAEMGHGATVASTAETAGATRVPAGSGRRLKWALAAAAAAALAIGGVVALRRPPAEPPPPPPPKQSPPETPRPADKLPEPAQPPPEPPSEARLPEGRPADPAANPTAKADSAGRPKPKPHRPPKRTDDDLPKLRPQ
jgi:eukaryotic-like serine/threonine-protein kinase